MWTNRTKVRAVYTVICAAKRPRLTGGLKIHDARRGRKFDRTNATAALNGNRVIFPRCYTGTTTAVVFEDWFAPHLLPSLREGSTVILDNARFHRKTEPDKPAKEAKVRLLFLPPYWADFNPIEET